MCESQRAGLYAVKYVEGMAKPTVLRPPVGRPVEQQAKSSRAHLSPFWLAPYNSFNPTMVLLCSDKPAHRMSRSGLYSRSPSRCRKESPHPRRRCTGSRHRKRYSRRSRLSGANIDTVTAGWDWDILVIHPSAHGQLGVGRQALIRDRFNRTSKRKSLWITPMCSWMSSMTRT